MMDAMTGRWIGIACCGLLLGLSPACGSGTAYVGPDGGAPGADGAGPPADGATGSPCDGVTCSGHGDCAVVGADAVCDCATGYHAEGLACVADLPPDPCDTTVCGANAECDQGVCVCLGGYEGDPVAGCTAIPSTEDAVRQELVDIATAELGYCEGVDDRPYMEWQPGLWCYDFVAWVYSQASYSLPQPLYLPTYQVGSLPQGWHAEAGDLIKFTIQHYGMVASVSGDGQVITTIEGNFNSCVMSRSISDPSVEYYGTLDGVL
jgi:hypothetical protein